MRIVEVLVVDIKITDMKMTGETSTMGTKETSALVAP
jgi:hypothetical protein